MNLDEDMIFKDWLEGAIKKESISFAEDIIRESKNFKRLYDKRIEIEWDWIFSFNAVWFQSDLSFDEYRDISDNDTMIICILEELRLQFKQNKRELVELVEEQIKWFSELKVSKSFCNKLEAVSYEEVVSSWIFVYTRRTEDWWVTLIVFLSFWS